MHIGITTALDYDSDRINCPRDYVEATRSAGGIPWLLPLFHRDTEAPEPREYLDGLDGLLLSGGVDVDPARFGEEPLPDLGSVTPERDAIELALTRRALEKDIPVLGICRGAQVLNIAAGGSVYQDINSQVGGVLQHRQTSPRWHPAHTISVTRDTRLLRILGSSRIGVNSVHHQSVRDLGSGLVVSARAPDGVIEAIESRDASFVVGVQWHPENMAKSSPPMRALFEAFMEAAKKHSRGLR